MRRLRSFKVVPQRLRQLAFERSKGRCEYCLFPARLTNAPMHCEHIIPKSKGGTSSPENLALACAWCNGFKGAKTHARDPKTGRLARLFNPRKDRWDRHFRWSDDLTRIEGLTAIGRATVEALKLNRNELVQLRMLLLSIGEHPVQKSER
ncbi:MAG: HNH endonuclease [Armatimonadetes bacterium]|nr:HNH endonuclease [Armatimonadota bacterium]MCX7968735.1 HNH endonuclease [Armatimonadota bacterium]MDW8143838.1 HNH endonuclease signature motif containing protein [Armatimonadota bacterium]